MSNLESLIKLSKIEENIFFDTCCLEATDDISFKGKKFDKLSFSKLEDLYDKLNLFLEFVRSNNVYAIEEIFQEVKVNEEFMNKKYRWFKGVISQPNKKQKLKRNKNKNLFYKIKNRLEEVCREVEKSIYHPLNNEIYKTIMNLMDLVSVCIIPPIEDKADKELIATAFYRAIVEDTSTSIVTRNYKDFFPLLVLTYDKFQYNDTLLRKLQNNKIKLYAPKSKPESNSGKYHLRIENSEIVLKKHSSDIYYKFNPLIQDIRESLVLQTT